MTSKTTMTMLLMVMAIGAISTVYAATTFFGEDCSLYSQAGMGKTCNDLNDLNDRLVIQDNDIKTLNSTIYNLGDSSVSLSSYRHMDLSFHDANIGVPQSIAGTTYPDMIIGKVSLFATEKNAYDGSSVVTDGIWYLHTGAIVELFRYDSDLSDHETLCTLTEGQTLSECNSLILTPQQPRLGFVVTDLGKLNGTVVYNGAGVELTTFGDTP